MKKKIINIQNEIDHRIKNNLNIVSSILGLQILDINNNNETIEDILKKNKLRIETLAMVHDSIYKSKDRLKIKFKKYIKDLTKLINKAYNSNVKVKIDSNDLILPLDTMLKIGIILNELFTNSLKHSFCTKNIQISLKKEKTNHYILIYHAKNDNTIDIEKLKQSKSLGIKLITLTVKQMKAQMKIKQNGGLVFIIKFPNKN